MGKKTTFVLKREPIQGEAQYTPKSFRWGSITGEAGAIYTLGDDAGFEMMIKDYFTVHLEKNGIPITKEVDRLLDQKAREKRIEIFRRSREAEIPDYLVALLSAPNKQEAARLIANTIIEHSDFGILISASKRIGYRHRIKSKDFVPEQLLVTDEDRSAFASSSIGPLDRKEGAAFRKIRAAFEQRKVHLCHLFQRHDEWHCFYFSFNDIESADNHWRGGSHVHYVSSKWCRLKPPQVLRLFDHREVNIVGDFHVRYRYPTERKVVKIPVKKFLAE